MSVRLRRMKADYDRLCTLFTQNARVRIKKTVGTPPEKYQFEYLVTGLEKTLEGHLRSRNNFLVEISLTSAYPRMAPQCKMLTPVFHPNIAPNAICIGDHWAAGEALPNLVVRIAEMLSYQSYNVKSPLNGDAAKWVQENEDKLPLDTFDFASMLSVGEAVGRTADGTLVAGDTCANCGKKGDAKEMLVCSYEHVCCADCALECPVCKQRVCLKCALVTCAACNVSACQKCSYKCGACERAVCANHQGRCHVCEHGRCNDCLVDCQSCGKITCLDHLTKVTIPGTAERRLLCSQCLAVPR